MDINNSVIEVGKLKGQKIRAFICGHTGATGKALMNALVASPHVESVVAVGRRENERHRNSPKVKQYVVKNMLELDKEDMKIAEGCNVAFCAIGTPFNDVMNKKKQHEYRAVDYGIATEFAKFARNVGIDYFATITGAGTDSNSSMNMYVVKREVENFVQTLGFERISFMRPGFLDRGKDAGWTEKIMLPGIFGTPVAKIAQSMIYAALTQTESVKGYSTKEIKTML